MEEEQDSMNAIQGTNEKSKKLSNISILGLVVLILGLALISFGIYMWSANRKAPAILNVVLFFGIPALIVAGIIIFIVGIIDNKKRENRVDNGLQKTPYKNVLAKSTWYSLAIVSVATLAYRMLVSLVVYSEMIFSSLPWAEGMVFFSFAGLINIPFLIMCLIFNLISVRRTGGASMIVSWILWVVVIVLTIMIIAYNP